MNCPQLQHDPPSFIVDCSALYRQVPYYKQVKPDQAKAKPCCQPHSDFKGNRGTFQSTYTKQPTLLGNAEMWIVFGGVF
jgi:hypothetical protein